MTETHKSNPTKTIVIAGANGFIGGKLIEKLSSQYSIVTLTRSPLKSRLISESYLWDGENQGDWYECLNGAYAVINLSGKSVNCRFTESNKKAILASRVNSTKAISVALEKVEQAPKVWLNASGVSIYKETFNDPQSEESNEVAEDFLAQVTQQWEDAFFSSKSNSRKLALRTSVVLDSRQGSFPLIAKLTRMFLGGRQGSGKQYFSWIHIEDYCATVEKMLLEDNSINGPVNIAAPVALTNSEFMRAVRNSLGIRIGLPAPKLLLKMGGFILGTEPSLVLKSTCVQPKVLLDSGYEFQYPTIELALKELNSEN